MQLRLNVEQVPVSIIPGPQRPVWESREVRDVATHLGYFKSKERAATIQVVVVWWSDTTKNSTRSAFQVSGIAEAGLRRHCFFSCPVGCLIQQFLDLNISKLMTELIDPHAFMLDQER